MAGIFDQIRPAGAPPTMAQGILSFFRNIPGALSAAASGNAFGTSDPNNAISDLERQRFWRGSVMGQDQGAQSRNMERALAVALAAPTVYQGSPHLFAPTPKNPLGEFNAAKIGTGEGAQAFGHGHYLAENPGVASDYQKTLSGTKFVEKATGKVFDSREIPMDKMSRLGTDFTPHTGYLYKVDLPDAMAAKMLDWDKPLSQQSPEVRDAINRVGRDIAQHGMDKITDDMRMIEFKRLLNSPEGVQRLREHGIPGIRYLDQGSRGAGQGTYNYVAFPGTEGMLKILERK